MGARRNKIRAMMDERPRLSYEKVAQATRKQTEPGSFTTVTISRWMRDEPTKEQAQVIIEAIERIRRSQ